MRIESRSSLTSAAHRSVAAVDKISGEVEDIAQRVASGVRSQPGRGGTAEIGRDLAKLSLARKDAAANLRVFETADDLLTKHRR